MLHEKISRCLLASINRTAVALILTLIALIQSFTIRQLSHCKNNYAFLEKTLFPAHVALFTRQVHQWLPPSLDEYFR
ncbi:MAG: hypothetical protein GKR96_06550 [Gammaproteobacteria bacterium]|nr:hypothetical protein [Gammaproteobacteria bacterium]